MFSDSSNQRLSEVHPKLAVAIRQMDAQYPALSIQVTEGLRNWATQDLLYQQGRTLPGNIVTNAKPGYSYHQFGLAVDLVPEDIMPGQPDWNVNHPAWKQMIASGESVGLVSGSEWRTFPDNPHFQMTGKLPVSPDDYVRYLFNNAGIQAVWEAADL